MRRWIATRGLAVAFSASPALAQAPSAPPRPQPTHANLEYAPAEPAVSNGHKLDLYIPTGLTGPLPVVIWTGGSAWMADTGKSRAGTLALQLNPAGYAVAGVSIRSSSMTNVERRWLREHRSPHAAHWNLLTDLRREHLPYAA
jgi:acetyl esterase/lipase